MRLVFALLLLGACASPPVGIDFIATDATSPLVRASLEFLPDPRVMTQTSATPRATAGRTSVTVAVVERTDCTDCYRIDRDGSRLVVSGGLPLGVQVAGAPGSDHVTIRVAEALEDAFGGWVPPTRWL